MGIWSWTAMSRAGGIEINDFSEVMAMEMVTEKLW
jgi:hypothetical protein